MIKHSLCPLLIAAVFSAVAAARGIEATTKPAKNTVSASISIEGVKLEYTGPSQVTANNEVMCSLRLSNDSDNDISMLSNIDEKTVSFIVRIDAPDGTRAEIRSPGAALDGGGDGILELIRGKYISDNIKLNRVLGHGEGEYYINIAISFNGVIRFPGRTIEIGRIPVFVKSPETQVKK